MKTVDLNSFKNYTNRNQNLDIYFAEIKKFDTLSKTDEERLFALVAEGNKMAETEIFNKMAKLILATAKTYTSDDTLLEDLIQEGNIGLLEAIKRYDITKDNRFSSFAIYWVRASISKYLNENGIVREKNYNTMNRINKIKETFYKVNERMPSEDELIEILNEMGVDVNDVTTIDNILVSSIDAARMNDDGDEDRSDDTDFARTYSSTNEYEDTIDDEYNKYNVTKLMSKLTEKEKLIISMKFGLGGNAPMDNESIAEKLYYMKVTTNILNKESIRIAAEKAIIKMRGI